MGFGSKLARECLRSDLAKTAVVSNDYESVERKETYNVSLNVAQPMIAIAER